MNSLNSILMEGNLVRDPEYKTTAKGTSLTKFTIACNKYYKVGEEFKEEVSYFDIVVWGREADNCNEHLSKGRGVRIIGSLKQDRWTDNDGKVRSRIVVIAEHVYFKSKNQQGPSGEAKPAQRNNPDEFEGEIPF